MANVGIARFEVGEIFSSFAELDKAKSVFEKENYISLCCRDTKTLEAAKKDAPKRVEGANKELVYYHMRLCCSFGGKKYKKQGEGKRVTQSLKMGCPMHVRLALSPMGQHLVVAEKLSEHNHEIDREVFSHLPAQRRLTYEERAETELLLSCNANKKMVQQRVQQTTGKPIILKDLANIAVRLKSTTKPNDLEDLVHQLSANGSSSVSVLTNEAGEFKGLTYQDAYMKKVYQTYPEIILLDATYKLLDLRMPVYILCAIDGNGMSEIVFVFLVVAETKETISMALTIFKEENESWQYTASVMTDKDFVERDVVRTLFPSASLLICRYHVLRTFRREVTCDKMCINSGQRDVCLSIISDMIYARSEEMYEKHRQRLTSLNLAKVSDYFASWHEIRQEWVEGLCQKQLTLGETTNNRLESINGKIKSVCSRYATLQQFFIELKIVLNTLRNERMHKSLMMSVKRPTAAVNGDLVEYRENLTTYAFQKVFAQYEQSQKLEPLPDGPVGNMLFASSAGPVQCTAVVCSCWHFTAVKLVCKHILCFRRLSKLPSYAEEVCNERWMKKGYMSHCQLKIASREDPSQVELSVNTLPNQVEKTLTQAEKYHRSKNICSTLASLCSEPGMCTYKERLAVLKQIASMWMKNDKVIISAEGGSSSLADDPDTDTETTSDELAQDGSATGIRNSSGVASNEPSAVEADRRHKPHVTELGNSSEPGIRLHPTTVLILPQCAVIDDVASLLEVDSTLHLPLKTKHSTRPPASTSNRLATTALSSTCSEPVCSVPQQDFNDKDVAIDVHLAGQPVGVHSSGSYDIAGNAGEVENIDILVNLIGQDEMNTELSKIVMPARLPKRGRPKGSNQTVIGLPKKRARSVRPTAFVHLPIQDRQRFMLKWFVDGKVAEAALDGQLVAENEVETRPDRVSSSCLDDIVVELEAIRHFFTSNAWTLVQEVVEMKSRQQIWPCPSCYKNAKEGSICCDGCLQWWHSACAGVKKRNTRVKEWFCAHCLG